MKTPRLISLRGLLTLLVLFLVLLVLRWAALEQLDALAYDLALRIRGPQPPDPRIVIVAVDEGSLHQTGPWPWPPDALNRLFRRILDQSPAVVAVDILLTRPLSEYPALSGEKRVVMASSLGVKVEDGQSRLFWEETPGLGQGGPAAGHIHADKDSDGICRSIPLSVSHAGTRRWAMALEAARTFWGEEPGTIGYQGPQLRIGPRSIPRLRAPLDDSLDSSGILHSLGGDHMLIHMRGGNNTFPYLSASQVLQGDPAAVKGLRGGIVMVGATAYSLGDHLSTPFSGPSEMPGVEIHANALDTILNQRFLGTLEEPQIVFWMLVCMLWTWWLFHVRTRHWALAAFAVSFVAALILPVLILNRASFWIPLASLATTVALTAATAQFSRFSALNQRVNQQFADLSRLLKGRLPSPLADSSPVGAAPFSYSYSLTRRFRSRSLEWKLEVLNQATENALQTLRVQQNLVSFLSHEFKTPLASMQGFAELLRDGSSLSQPDRAAALDLIQSESGRLAKMVDDYLDLSRLEQGMTPVRMEKCAVDELVRKACATMGPQFREKRITLQGLEELPRGAFLEGDESLLIQVFLNLLSNAVKFSPHGSAVQIGTDQTPQRIRVSLCDQGPGISETDQPRLFDKFFRAVPDGSDSPPGSGLGLAFVRTVAELHQGTVSVKSELGGGSTFSLDLPRVREAVSQQRRRRCAPEGT